MDEPKRELTQGWLTKASHDLASARKLAADPDAYLDTAIYHCQQAAEKGLKAFLVFHDEPFAKTHDLRALRAAAQGFDARLAEFADTAELLTPYATRYRYPGDYPEPDRDEFQEALEAAEALLSFLLGSLPKDVHPR